MPLKLTENDLISRKWKFFHKGGPVVSTIFTFMQNGKIGGYSHRNERSWRIDDGIAVLFDEDGIVTTILDTVVKGPDGLELSGEHLPAPGVVLCLVEHHEARPRFHGTKTMLEKEALLHHWTIGEHTYGIPEFVEPGLAKLKIGKYCSIAGEVIISFGNHRMDTVSTYPFFAFRPYWPCVPERVTDHTTKGDIVIGNDVWIGNGAFIGSGVTIGDGAVIGAKTVVTKNVPPYGVVVGNPGRLIRHRFSDKIIAGLLDIAWWDWPDEKVDRYLPLMLSGDMRAFITAAEKNPGAGD